MTPYCSYRFWRLKMLCKCSEMLKLLIKAPFMDRKLWVKVISLWTLWDKAACLVLLHQPSVPQLAHKSQNNNDWCRISTQYTPSNWLSHKWHLHTHLGMCLPPPHSPTHTKSLSDLRFTLIVLSKRYKWRLSWITRHSLLHQTASAHSRASHHRWCVDSVCCLRPPPGATLKPATCDHKYHLCTSEHCRQLWSQWGSQTQKSS